MAEHQLRGSNRMPLHGAETAAAAPQAPLRDVTDGKFSTFPTMT